MALPSEYRTERLIFLECESKKYKIHEFENLTNDDFLLLGKYIQMYCFIELNIHRVFNELKSRGLFEIGAKDKINIPYIIKKLIFAIELGLIEISKTDDVIAKLNEIKFRRDYRNIFAHWAAKRIPNEDGFIFFTGGNQDYKKVHKKSIEPDMISYAIFDIADIRGLVVHLSKYEEWVAHFCADIYNKNKSL